MKISGCQWDQEAASPKICLLWKVVNDPGSRPAATTLSGFYFSLEAAEVFEVHCAMISGSYQNLFHIES